MTTAKPDTQASSTDEILVVTRNGGIVTWRLNRPEQLNALSPALGNGLLREATAAVADPSIECIVITGTGRAFCAGGDMGSIKKGTESGSPGSLAILQRAMHTLIESPIPVLTAVNGVAAGAGFGLALLGDLSIVSSAARFRPSFIALGATPDLGLAYTLPRLIGEVRAREALLTNREFSADEALALNLVTRVVPHDRFDTEVTTLAEQLAAAPRAAYGLTKQLMKQGRTLSLADFWERELLAQLTAFRSPEIKEGVAAFQARRKPDFRAARRGTD
jgi:2-(1,2-epoxy-1,2-dihydrophenyl)acetyl-CoA isomerase